MAIRTYPSQPSPLGGTVTLTNIDYGAGVTTTQTLRVVVATDQTPIAVTTTPSALDFGASAAAGRVAALLGNTNGIASFGAGTTGAQTLRAVLATDQSAIPATQSGTWNITNVSGTVSLPTGASTSALQTTGNTSLASLDTKAVQQALTYGTAAGALRVAAQIGNTLGEVSYDAGVTNGQTIRVVIATNQSAIPVSQSGAWSVSSVQSGAWTVAATQSGSWSTGRTWTLASGTDSIASVQSGTWTTARSWTLASGTDSVSAVQSGTWNITNISGTVSLPTGASTSALQTTGNTSLSSIDTKTVQGALDYGVSSGAHRVAAQIGNASAVADFNAGNSGVQTLRVVIATNQSKVSTAEQNVLVPFVFDAISANLAGATTDVYTYKTGGTGGTTVATVTVTWTDSTKTVLTSVVRT